MTRGKWSAVLPVLAFLFLAGATPAAAIPAAATPAAAIPPIAQIATLQRAPASLLLSPTAGPPGSPVGVIGAGCHGGATLTVSFDSQPVGLTTADPSGGFNTTVTIPIAAVDGAGTIQVVGPGCQESASFSAQEGIVQNRFAANSPGGLGPWEVAAGMAVLAAVLVLAIRRRRTANAARKD